MTASRLYPALTASATASATASPLEGGRGTQSHTDCVGRSGTQWDAVKDQTRTATVKDQRPATRCTRPPRPPAPTPAQILRAEISELARQIDRRLGNRPGTAERGIFFWYWPPPDVHCLDVLTRLHADAVEFLGAVTGPGGDDR